MRRVAVIFLLMFLAGPLARAQYASINFDEPTTIAMVGALGSEFAQEELTRKQWEEILKHYVPAELASAGIFASKLLDRQALKNEMCFSSEENWYYRHIRQMVAQRIMPRIFNVASMLVKHPDRAVYWLPYLYEVTVEVKQLCMIFQAVCSNGKLSFKDIHFLVLVDELKDFADLSRFGNVDWERMWNNIANIKGITWDDLEDDFLSLVSVGGSIASAGGTLLDDLWVQASKSGDLLKMSPKEILNLGNEYRNTFESLNSVAKVKDKLMSIIGTTDSMGVARLFKFADYNISDYITDYLHAFMGSYYRQRWYIYWHDAGQEEVDSWEPPIDDDSIINGHNGWYRINTTDANYQPPQSVLNAAKAACASSCGWSQARCDQLNAEQSFYHYYLSYTLKSYYIYRGNKKNVIGWSFSYIVRVYRSWNGGDTVYEEMLDTYTTTEAAFAQHMESKLMEIEGEDMAAHNSDRPTHQYMIGKDEKVYYEVPDATRMRGCTAVEFWLNCENGSKLAEGSTEWKIQKHIHDDERPSRDVYRSESMITTLVNDGSEMQEYQDRIQECKDNIARLSDEINALNARQRVLLNLISSSSYQLAQQYQREYNSNRNTISTRQAERQQWEEALSKAQDAYSQAHSEYVGETDRTYRIPAIEKECEANYGVEWTDDGHWEDMTWVRGGKIESMGVNVVFRATISNKRPEEWLDCLFFSLRIHRSVMRLSWELLANYSTSDQVDVMQFSNDISDEERSRLVNERQQEIMAEHPDCSVELRYQYSENKQDDEDNGTYHLLWMSDRLRIAREVDMRLTRINSRLELLERRLRHSQSLLDYLVAPLVDAYRQGMHGAVANESFRRWRQSSLDALHAGDDEAQRNSGRNAPVVPRRDAALPSVSLRITENSPSDEE